MTLPARTPIPFFVPESAPFTPEQRTWLNGFFAGLISLDIEAVPLTAESAAGLIGELPALPAATPAESDDDTPWHDQTLPLAERMKLAEGRSLRQRLMAAMGQQDCGQCGYTCRGYADGIFGKAEKRLNLCVPGGKETTRMLTTLHAELAVTA